MAAEVVIPRLGWSMEEGTFGEWLKPDGSTVSVGEPLFVLEGEKSAQDIEAVDAGILRIPAGAPRGGETVLVGQVVAWICGVAEPCPPLPSRQGGGGPPVPAPTKSEAVPALTTPAVSDGTQEPAAAAVAPAVRPVPTVPPAVSATTGLAGVRVAEKVLANRALSRGEAEIAGADRLRVTPRARRAARVQGVDLAGVRGTGRAGRIRERDVLAASTRPSHPSGLHPVSPIRRTIAARMLAASQGTAPVTLHRRCDATNLVNLRRQFAAGRAGAVVPSYTELLVKLVGCVLTEFPEVRTRWVDDTTLETVADCHIAVAVDTPQGLLAPVVQRVDARPLVEVAEELRDLAERARAGQMSSAELTGGVFTVTNLGALGVEYFTPVLNLPQAAILGVGSILREAVVEGNELAIGERLSLSLTFDHRLLDGAPAARFLQAVCLAIENPAAWLVA